MTWIRSAIFNLICLILALIGMLITFTFLPFPRSWSVAWARVWTRLPIQLAQTILGLSYEVLGLEHIPDHAPFLVACKHQSFWETLVLMFLFQDPAFILKKSLMYNPISGPLLLKLQMIPIRRDIKKQIFRSILEKSEKIASTKRPIIIFPEGKRTDPEQNTHYFSGIFALYNHLKLPVLPIGLNSGYFWKRRTFCKYPGKITLHLSKPILPGLERKAFMKELKNIIESTSLPP